MGATIRKTLKWAFLSILVTISLLAAFVVGLAIWYMWEHRFRPVARVSGEHYEIITERMPIGFGTNQAIKVYAEERASGDRQLLLVASARDTVDVEFPDPQTARLYLLKSSAGYPSYWFATDTFTYRLDRKIDPVRID